MNALMLCRNIDNEWHPEIANPHYFKMPNGQLVLFATDTHILLILKDTAGLLQKYDFDTAERPNIAAVIPTANCDQTLSMVYLRETMRRIIEKGWADNVTAIDIDGVLFHAPSIRKMIDVLDNLDAGDLMPMWIKHEPATMLKIETEQFIIVQSGMVDHPDFYNHRIKYMPLP